MRKIGKQSSHDCHTSACASQTKQITKAQSIKGCLLIYILLALNFEHIQRESAMKIRETNVYFCHNRNLFKKSHRQQQTMRVKMLEESRKKANITKGMAI